MNFWIDAQLPPSLANWLVETFSVNATAIRDLGLRDAEDIEIFNAARNPGTVIVSKDSDFAPVSYSFGNSSSNSLVDLWECY
jgi:predicted nuclease of predicted toxin-antitoxin system